MDAAAKGAQALEQKDYAGAVQRYSEAITANPQAVDYYIKRSTAFSRLSPPSAERALADAELAVVLARKRGKRELIAQAQLRRGVAFFAAEKWAAARACFGWARQLLPDDKSLGIWDVKVQDRLNALKLDDPQSKSDIPEVPDIDLTEKTTSTLSTSAPTTDGKKEEPVGAVKSSTTASPASGTLLLSASKIRHDWYQSADIVTLTLLAKGVSKDTLVVDFEPTSLSITFPLPTGSNYDFSLDPLFAPIDPSASSYRVMSTKIELALRKAEVGRKWHTLEGKEEPLTTLDATSKQPNTVKSSMASTAATTGPVYPTSSKHGPKDWDKLASSLTKRRARPDASTGTAGTAKSKTPHETSDSNKQDDSGNDDRNKENSNKTTRQDDGDAEADFDDGLNDEDEDGDSGDAVNAFFQKLYKDADPDTRRAMMKSYQESNGTALSTNWSEVKKGPVETSPPEGMVAKKWGE